MPSSIYRSINRLNPSNHHPLPVLVLPIWNITRQEDPDQDQRTTHGTTAMTRDQRVGVLLPKIVVGGDHLPPTIVVGDLIRPRINVAGDHQARVIIIVQLYDNDVYYTLMNLVSHVHSLINQQFGNRLLPRRRRQAPVAVRIRGNQDQGMTDGMVKYGAVKIRSISMTSGVVHLPRIDGSLALRIAVPGRPRLPQARAGIMTVGVVMYHRALTMPQ